MSYPNHLIKLIQVLRRLPGVGLKSAERFAFQMLTWPPHQMKEMGDIVSSIPSKIKNCPQCGCLNDGEQCPFCQDSRKQPAILCIVASPRDVYSVEETGEYRGLYHVLGGLLSPMDGMGPDQLNLGPLKQRIRNCAIKEVIIALDSTLEGDTTSLFLKEELEPLGTKVSRLAFGMPMGSSIDYVDGGTLARAFSGRSAF